MGDDDRIASVVTPFAHLLPLHRRHEWSSIRARLQTACDFSLLWERVTQSPVNVDLLQHSADGILLDEGVPTTAA